MKKIKVNFDFEMVSSKTTIPKEMDIVFYDTIQDCLKASYGGEEITDKRI